MTIQEDAHRSLVKSYARRWGLNLDYVADRQIAELLVDVNDRHTIKWGFQQLDDEVKADIVSSWRRILNAERGPR